MANAPKCPTCNRTAAYRLKDGTWVCSFKHRWQAEEDTNGNDTKEN